MNHRIDDVERPEPGLELLVEFAQERVEVFRASPLPRTSRLLVRAPQLVEANLAALSSGLSEMVLATLDASGAVVEEFGYPVPGRRFHDFGNPEAGTLRGGPRPIPAGERDLRALLVPWPARGSFFFFYRTDVRAGFAGLELRRQPLLLVQAGGDVARRPERLPHGLPVPRVIPLPTGPPWEGRARPLPWMDISALSADGSIVGVVSDPANGDPAASYDIIITGDGFAMSDLGRFDALATQLKNGLAAMEPFASMGSRINWHVIRVASADSGINNCPNPAPSVPPKRTFFGVEGCWENTGAPGFLGTHYPERIQWAAEHVAPWSQVDLVIVIANCGVWGGHAWPAWKTAIVTTSNYLFVELASHECGHVIAELAEEYIVCVKDNPMWPDHNKARLVEVGRSVARKVGAASRPLPLPTDTIWWRHFTPLPGERNPDGTFAAVLTVLSPVVSTDGISPDERPGQEGFIGAFWGCQDAITINQLQHLVNLASTIPGVNLAAFQDLLDTLTGEGRLRQSDEDIACNPFWDPRSAVYFRPSAHCRMRHPRYGFCRVCRHLMSNRIRLAAGEQPLNPLP